jgi:small subunit ribosomal protein S20
MPNTPSAKKRQRTNEQRRVRNRAVKSAVKTQIKKVTSAMTDGKSTDVDAEFRATVKKLDKAAAKGVIHKNAAARTKSRLSARIKATKSK